MLEALDRRILTMDLKRPYVWRLRIAAAEFAAKKISHNAECVRIDDLVRAAIPWPINEKAELNMVSPTGFLPDFNEDYTRIIDENVYTHVSAQLIGATDWIGDNGDKMISVRTNKDDSGDAKILYYYEGVGYGYCFCSKCGRMVLVTEPAPDGNVAGAFPAEMNNKQLKWLDDASATGI